MTIGIAIVGGNGSGKTTLGKYLSNLIGYKHMDIEDYYFPESAIPYSICRTREEVKVLMLEDINKHGNFILSSINCDFDNEINKFFKYIICIDVPLSIRIDRVKQRAIDKFGNRVLEGGDMYEREQLFFESVSLKKLEKTDLWVKSMNCHTIYIDGTKPIIANENFILEQLIYL